MRTYRDIFPIGTRVVVRADKSDGSDHEFNGRRGTMVEIGKCLGVQFDNPPKHWPNPYLISLHTLRHLKETPP